MADDRALLEDLYAPLRRFAAVVGPLEVEPDDLVQEAMVQVLQRGALDRYDDLGAYQRRTILNLAANHRRSLGRRRRALTRLRAGLGRHPGVEEPAYPSDVDLLLRLKPDVRAVLYLAEVEGWTYAEIGDALGCGEAAARTRAARGRRRLRLELTEEG